MNEQHISSVAAEFALKPLRVAAVVALLDEGSTVPFIARYRKEVTGSMDEVAITSVRDRIGKLRELDKRREAIVKALHERGQLTEELAARILAAPDMTTLEDVYLPYKPKRRTRATMAREKGLEPLATLLFAQQACDLQQEAMKYIAAEKGVEDAEQALAGARDIIAEWVNEDETGRRAMRELFRSEGLIVSKLVPGMAEQGAKFKDYFDWQEPAIKAPSHRILAMRRGENEGILSLRIMPPEETATDLLESIFVTGSGTVAEQVRLAVRDAYKRLLSASMETEIRLETKKRADEEAIQVFADNVRQLLLGAPLGQKRILALDPGFRTGCKLVCLGAQGELLFNTAIFPHGSEQQRREAGNIILALCQKFAMEAIAVGNGTAGRETEQFLRTLPLPPNLPVIMVDESGASVYSASEAAREEFPDHDLTVRGAVSIGRRLMDPLSELVKIDPKAIGVGQYQHDVNQNDLRCKLDDTVIHCVNRIGVDVNTASRHLLGYVSGLGPQLAANVVAYRNENGPFRSRAQLKKVPRLGPKAFEQAAGFLRIRGGSNPLDASAVHPENYDVVKAIVHDLGCDVRELLRSESRRREIDIQRYVSDRVGIPTLKDIMSELAKPGRDPRQSFEIFSFADDVHAIDDLRIGMKVPGIVTNVTRFGAFVDIGVHNDGLIHISELSDGFVEDPHDIVKVQQKVRVTVLSIDRDRKRIALSMRSGETPPSRRPRNSRPAPPSKPQQDRARSHNEQSRSFSNNPFRDAFRKR